MEKCRFLNQLANGFKRFYALATVAETSCKEEYAAMETSF